MQSLVVMSHLSPDEVARYRRDGFVVPQYRLPAARVAKMRDALDELLRLNPTVRPEKLVSAHIECSGACGGDGVRGVAAFLDLARDPEIVGLVSDIIGEDVILWGAHVFCKPAGEGYETPWHQVRDAWCSARHWHQVRDAWCSASLIERRDICYSEQCRHVTIIPFVGGDLALSCLVLLDAVSLMSH
jgi:hypothetical protein